MDFFSLGRQRPSRSITSSYPSLSVFSILILTLLATQASAASTIQRRRHQASSSSTPHLSTLVFDRDATEDALLSRRQSSDGNGPTAFDRGFGAANMTSSCALFFKSFLQDSSMTDCQPISLLLAVGFP